MARKNSQVEKKTAWILTDADGNFYPQFVHGSRKDARATLKWAQRRRVETGSKTAQYAKVTRIIGVNITPR